MIRFVEILPQNYTSRVIVNQILRCALSVGANYRAEGYRTAYYIASGIYVVACMLLMAGLWKYNRAAPNKEEGRS